MCSYSPYDHFYNTKQKDFKVAVLLFILFSVVPCLIFAQQKTFRFYTMNDGLVNNHIQSVFQDDDGFIWFATLTGISIYDGHQFTNYTAENGGITDDIIIGFFKKSNDETWVVENTCTEVFVKRRRIKKISIPAYGFLSSNYLLTRNGRVLISAGGKIFEIKNSKPDSIAYVEKEIGQMFEVGNYFLFKDAAADSYSISDKSFHILQTLNGKIFKDYYNRFWLLDSQFYLLDTIALQQGAFKLLPVAVPLKQNNIKAEEIKDFLADRDGFYWLLSATKGIIRIDKEGNVIRYNLSPENLAPINFMEDAEGNVWIPAPGIGGVLKFFNKHIDVYTVGDGLPSNWIYSISEDTKNHSVWFANKKSLSCIYHNQVFNFPYPANHEESGWITVSVQQDSLWLTAKGVFLYKVFYTPQPHLKELKHWVLGNGNDDLTSGVYKDEKGAFFITIEWHGLYRGTDDGKLEKIYPGENLGSVVVDKNELWMALKNNGGVARWKMIYGRNGVQLQLMQQYQHLPDDHVFHLKMDSKGNLWLGTVQKGLLKLEKQKNDSFVVRHYNSKDGPNGWVQKILIGSKGQVYVGTLGGLFELDETHDSTQFENLSKKFELEGQIYDITQTADGNFWLATDEGLVYVRTNLSHKIPSPKIFFTQMLKNNEPDSSIFLSSSNKRFSYKENNLSFAFSTTSFLNEEHVLYSYQLNKDNDTSQWSVPQNVHTVSLLSLSPGSYTLKVKALIQDNVPSEVAQYSFVINAPFWSTWWFRTLVIVFVASVVAGFYRYRLNQLRKVMTIRTKISRDLHDEIGSTLSGIGLMSEMAKQQIESKNYKGVKNALDKINLNSEEILTRMSDIVWTINPLNDTFEKLVSRLKIYARSIAMPLGIQLHFESGASVQQLSLAMQQRNNIYLICKEAINNAIKYSECRNLYFDVGSNDHQFQIRIWDDGRGFDARQSFDGNGLKNMQSRADEIKAAFCIESEKNKGTLIKLQVKIT